eukprot:m51a1_g1236 hypothetical protein (196) ;mRNA; f:546884-547675
MALLRAEELPREPEAPLSTPITAAQRAPSPTSAEDSAATIVVVHLPQRAVQRLWAVHATVFVPALLAALVVTFAFADRQCTFPMRYLYMPSSAVLVVYEALALFLLFQAMRGNQEETFWVYLWKVTRAMVFLSFGGAAGVALFQKTCDAPLLKANMAYVVLLTLGILGADVYCWWVNKKARDAATSIQYVRLDTQ